jgi:hypothetical protein
MALMDDIKKSLTSGFQLPQFGQSEQLRRMQRASSGKIARDEGPEAISLAEQVAATAAEQQQQEDILFGKIQAEQLSMEEKAQQEAARQQGRELDEKRLNMQQDLQNKISNILQEYSQRVGEIDMREDSAKTQYVTTLMRLSNEDYIDQLEVEGAQSRLQDQASFEWELAQSVFDSELELLKNDLEFRSSIAAENREWKEYMAEWTLDQAMELALTDLDAAERLAQIEATAEMVSATARGVAKVAGSSASKPTTLGPARDARNIGIQEQSGLDTNYLPDSGLEYG